MDVGRESQASSVPGLRRVGLDIVMGIACSCGGTHFPGPYHCFAEVMVYWNMQYMRHFCTGPCPDAGDTCNDMGPRQDDSFCECYH